MGGERSFYSYLNSSSIKSNALPGLRSKGQAQLAEIILKAYKFLMHSIEHIEDAAVVFNDIRLINPQLLQIGRGEIAPSASLQAKVLPPFGCDGKDLEAIRHICGPLKTTVNAIGKFLRRLYRFEQTKIRRLQIGRRGPTIATTATTCA